MENKGDKNITKQLKALLDEQSKTIAKETIQNDGRVPAYKMDALERLARLKEIRSTATAAKAHRWQIPAALGLTLVILSVLFFARVRSTEIELDLSLTELSFVLSKPQVLTNLATVSELGASGLQKIEIPDAEGKDAFVLESSGSSIHLMPDTLESSATLAVITREGGTRTWFRATDNPNFYRLSLQGASQPLQVDVIGRIRVSIPGSLNEALSFLSPRPILLYPDSSDASLDLNIAIGPSSLFPVMLQVDSLSFFEIDDYTSPDKSVIRKISSIESGKIYFESLGGVAHDVRQGTEIRFDKLSGNIRKLQLRGNHIHLTFHGRVSGMTTGSELNRKSLMPTYLEWLKANHSLSLLWGSVLYLFGVAIGILNWWKKAK